MVATWWVSLYSENSYYILVEKIRKTCLSVIMAHSIFLLKWDILSTDSCSFTDLSCQFIKVLLKLYCHHLTLVLTNCQIQSTLNLPHLTFLAIGGYMCLTYASCLLFLCPPIEWSGAYCFCPVCLSVCLSVCLFVCLSVVNFNICYNFWTVRVRDFIFGMHTSLMISF